MSTPYEVAIKMQSLGYTVIPGGAGDDGKHPIIDWKVYQGKKTTLEQVMGWEDEFHPRAWGIVTGPTNGTFEIDDDTRTPGGNPLLKDFKKHVRTPHGGTHTFCKYPLHKVPNKQPIIAGIKIDSRGEGGYSQFTGTTPDGKYEIIELPMPDNLPTFEDLPDCLRIALQNAISEDKHVSENTTGNTGGDIPFGAQDSTLLRNAGRYRKAGDDKAAIKAKLLVDMERCPTQPGRKPYTEDDAERMADSVCRYPQGTVNHPLTDLGNAERLVDKYGDTIRYSYERKLWLVFNGKYWKWDNGSQIMIYAQSTARTILNEAAAENDKDKREDTVKWAKQSEK